jgi:hypothetical protein
MNLLARRTTAPVILRHSGLAWWAALSPRAYRLKRFNRIGDVDVTELTGKVAAGPDLAREWKPGHVAG